MITDLLHRAAIKFPDHPFTAQELTVTFICWLAHVENLFDRHVLNPPELTQTHIDLLWDCWQAYSQKVNSTQQQLAPPPV